MKIATSLNEARQYTAYDAHATAEKLAAEYPHITFMVYEVVKSVWVIAATSNGYVGR